MGKINTYNGPYPDRVLFRGGIWANSSIAGVFELDTG